MFFRFNLWREDKDKKKDISGRYFNDFTPSVDLNYALKHFPGKKYECAICKNEYEDNEIVIHLGVTYCTACRQGFFN